MKIPVLEAPYQSFSWGGVSDPAHTRKPIIEFMDNDLDVAMTRLKIWRDRCLKERMAGVEPVAAQPKNK